MADLKLVGWTYFESDYPTKKLNAEELELVIQLIQDEITKNDYVFSGEEHQNSLTGVPVFSDGTCFRASMRCWGSLMASLYARSNGEQCTYMDFYMSLGDSAIMPKCTELEVEPATLEEESIGCTTKVDKQTVQEAIDMDMMFMTTDKVLKKMYQKMKDNK